MSIAVSVQVGRSDDNGELRSRQRGCRTQHILWILDEMPFRARGKAFNDLFVFGVMLLFYVMKQLNTHVEPSYIRFRAQAWLQRN